LKFCSFIIIVVILYSQDGDYKAVVNL